MLNPKYRRGRSASGSSCSSTSSGGGRSSFSNGDIGAPTDSPGVGYDGIPSFNVTVSLQPKSPLRAASQPGGSTRNSASTINRRSAGSASYGSRSLGSASTVVSQSPSLAESIGDFDAEALEAEAKKGVAGSGLLPGDMSAAFPASIQRAEEVLQHTRETLARADGRGSKAKVGARRASGGEASGGRLSTEELEGLSRALKRALFVCPNHKELHAMRGEVHRRLQDFRTAVNSLRLAVRMDKSVLSVRQRLAEVLLSQGMVWLDGADNEAALACFEEACTVDGANACAHFCKTVALVKLTRFVEALRAMEAVLGRRKGTADDYVMRAKIRWAMGMVGPGNADMDVARSLRSDHPEVVMYARRCLGDAESLFAKAKTFADAGDDIMAVKVLNQVAAVTPDDVKVLVVRAACKRRLKDFVGALRDYDECSFRHYRGVQVGRRALVQAADQLKSMQEGGVDGKVGGPGGSPVGQAGGGHHEVSTPAVVARVAGTVAPDENAGRIETPASCESLGENTHNVNIDKGGNSGDNHGDDDEAAGGDGGRKAVGTNGDSGGDGLAADKNAPAATTGGDMSKGSLAATGTLGDNTGTPRPTAEQIAVAAGKLVEKSETQAVNERSAEAELRRRFRLAIPHAGRDPAYLLRRPRSCLEQGLPTRRHDQSFPEELGQSREQQPQQRVLMSTSYNSRGVSRRGEGGQPRDFILSEGGSEGQQDEQAGDEQRRRWQQQQQHQQQQQQQQQHWWQGEGYAEPAYITRQRCLVLNDWGLSLFQIGEHAKAVSALDLAIEGDRVYATVTGGSMESNFLLNRGDCYRGGGAAEMAVRDYKRALEVEPGNWMVKTRLSLAHYLKGNRLFNDGNFPGAKSELDTAISYNWKISTYYISRGHAQFFGGRISDAHADYRRALELDPGNAEASRLCRQFDAKGKLTSASDRRNDGSDSKKHLLPAPPRSEATGQQKKTYTSSLPSPFHPSNSSSSSTSNSSPPSSTPSTWSLPPPSRPSRALRSPAPASPTSKSAASRKTAKTAAFAGGSTADPASAKQCKKCGSVAGGCTTSQARTGVAVAGARAVADGSVDGGTLEWKQKRPRRRVRRRGRKLHLPKVDTGPPKAPEWREEAAVWAKAGHDGVKRVFKERLAGVPARDERLWGMLRTCAKKSWSAAAAPAGAGGPAPAASLAEASTTTVVASGGGSVLSSRMAPTLVSSLSATIPEDFGWPVGLRGVAC